MQLQYINDMLGLPELQIHEIQSIDANEVHLLAAPIACKQSCPACHSEQFVKRDGSNKLRKIRHLAIFGKRCYLRVPAIRLACTSCKIGFVWAYHFAGPKQRYSHLCRKQMVEQALGSTAAHSARMQEAPASTVQRIHQEALPLESERIVEKVWKKPRPLLAWCWASTTLPSKKGIRTILAFTIFEGKRCWICLRVASWKIYALMPASIPIFLG